MAFKLQFVLFSFVAITLLEIEISSLVKLQQAFNLMSKTKF